MNPQGQGPPPAIKFQQAVPVPSQVPSTSKRSKKVSNKSKRKQKKKRSSRFPAAATGSSGSDTDVSTKNVTATIAPKQSSSENLARLPSLSEEEYIFFNLVKEGDLVGLKDFIHDKAFSKVHINKTDKFGYCALHHAVRQQNEEMVDLLLEQKGVLTHDVLFHAIKEENVDIVKKILHFEDQNKHLQTPMKIHPLASSVAITSSTAEAPLVTCKWSRQDVQDINDFDSEFPPYFTPLLVAAQVGNEDLMEIFHSRGETLENDDQHHNVGCTCCVCKCVLDGGKFAKSLTSAYVRRHLFEALTNPKYICFITGKAKGKRKVGNSQKWDPAQYAIEKIKKCKEIKKEKQIRSKYKEYIKRLSEFIKDLVDLCRTNQESEVFFRVPDPIAEGRLRGKYPRLWTIVGLRLVDVVARPHTQYVAYNQWTTSGWSEWNTYNVFLRLFHLLLRIMFLPIYSIIIWCGFDSDFGRRMGSPVSRYLNLIASYIFFLVTLCCQAVLPQRCNRGHYPRFTVEDGKCNERGMPTIGTEFVLMAWTLGFCISILKKHAIPWYWKSHWAKYDVVMQITFVATYICWFTALWGPYPDKEERREWGQHYPEVMAECFLTVSIILAFARTFWFLLLERHIGLIQLILGKMVTNFLWVSVAYSLVLVSFMTGVNAIYVPYHDMSGWNEKHENATQASPFGSPETALQELFWSLFGMSGSDKPNIIYFAHPFNETENILKHPGFTEKVGKFFSGFYHILGILMMFNMLVAYFSKGTEKIQENADAEWKFARTQVYLTCLKDTALAPPFNILGSESGWSSCCSYVGLLGGRKSRKKEKRATCSFRQCCYIEMPDNDDDEQRNHDYKRLILELIHRYHNLLVERSNESPATSDDVKEIGEELAELKSQIQTRLQELHKQVQRPEKPKPAKPAHEPRYIPETTIGVTDTSKRFSTQVPRISMKPSENHRLSLDSRPSEKDVETLSLMQTKDKLRNYVSIRPSTSVNVNPSGSKRRGSTMLKHTPSVSQWPKVSQAVLQAPRPSQLQSIVQVVADSQQTSAQSKAVVAEKQAEGVPPTPPIRPRPRPSAQDTSAQVANPQAGAVLPPVPPIPPRSRPSVPNTAPEKHIVIATPSKSNVNGDVQV